MVIHLLAGEKCILRALEPNDAKVLSKIVNNWEVRKFLAQFLPFTEEDELAFINFARERMKAQTDFIFGIEHKTDKLLIGTISLNKVDWKNRHAELGIAIWNPNYWNKGIGTDAINVLLKYAFDELGLHKVYLRVFEFNKRAIRCYEKIGFKIKGTFRDDLWRDGKYYNSLYMDILDYEFRK